MSNFLFFSSFFHFTACFLVLLLLFLTKAWFNNRVIINTVLLVLNCLLYDIIYDHHEYFLYLSRSECFYRYQKYQSVRVNSENEFIWKRYLYKTLQFLRACPDLQYPLILSLPFHSQISCKYQFSLLSAIYFLSFQLFEFVVK